MVSSTAHTRAKVDDSVAPPLAGGATTSLLDERQLASDLSTRVRRRVDIRVRAAADDRLDRVVDGVDTERRIRAAARTSVNVNDRMSPVTPTGTGNRDHRAMTPGALRECAPSYRSGG
jgi:hypothetical protein